jgi:hypothetical protein
MNELVYCSAFRRNELHAILYLSVIVCRIQVSAFLCMINIFLNTNKKFCNLHRFEFKPKTTNPSTPVPRLGVDVMITIFCNFQKTQCYHPKLAKNLQYLQHKAPIFCQTFRRKYCKNHCIGPRSRTYDFEVLKNPTCDKITAYCERKYLLYTSY